MRLMENGFVYVHRQTQPSFVFFFSNVYARFDFPRLMGEQQQFSEPKTCNKKCCSLRKSCLRFRNIAMGSRSWSLWLTELISPLPVRRRTQPMKFVALVKMYKFGKHSVWHLVGALSHIAVAM